MYSCTGVQRRTKTDELEPSVALKANAVIGGEASCRADEVSLGARSKSCPMMHWKY